MENMYMDHECCIKKWLRCHIHLPFTASLLVMIQTVAHYFYIESTVHTNPILNPYLYYFLLAGISFSKGIHFNLQFLLSWLTMNNQEAC